MDSPRESTPEERQAPRIRRAPSWATAIVLSLAVLCSACARDPGEAVAAPEVPNPDLAHLEPQVAESMRLSREAVLQSPESADAWGALGAVYDAHLLTDLAELCYRQARRLAADDFRWVYLLAVVRELNGADAEELDDLFGRAAELRPDYAMVPLRLGDALGRRGRARDALAALDRAIALAPDAALAHRRRGQIVLSRGDAAQAVVHLERAVELQPRDLTAHIALAQALTRLGEVVRARAVLERSRDLEPVNFLNDPVHAGQVVARNVGSDHLFGLAVQAIQAGRLPLAIDALGVVISATPGNPSAHYWLGTAYLRSGRPAPAMDHLSRAVQIAPRMNAARLPLADLLVAAGHTDEAAAHYREALRYAPNDASIRGRLEKLAVSAD